MTYRSPFTHLLFLPIAIAGGAPHHCLKTRLSYDLISLLLTYQPSLNRGRSLAAVAITSDNPGASIWGATRLSRTRDATHLYTPLYSGQNVFFLRVPTAPAPPGHTRNQHRKSRTPVHGVIPWWDYSEAVTKPFHGLSGGQRPGKGAREKETSATAAGWRAGGSLLGIVPRATSLDAHMRQSGSGDEQNSWESPQRLVEPPTFLEKGFGPRRSSLEATTSPLISHLTESGARSPIWGWETRLLRPRGYSGLVRRQRRRYGSEPIVFAKDRWACNPYTRRLHCVHRLQRHPSATPVR